MFSDVDDPHSVFANLFAKLVGADLRSDLRAVVGFVDHRKVFEQIKSLDILSFDRMTNPRSAFVVLRSERIVFGEAKMSVA